MYRLVCVSSSEERMQDATCSILAGGFDEWSTAETTLSRWLEIHYPEASFDGERRCWWVAEEDGPVHCVFIDPWGIPQRPLATPTSDLSTPQDAASA
jgi:hypothetical protein